MSEPVSTFKTICNLARRLKHDEEGFVLVLSVLLIPVLFFALGLVFDVSSAFQERSKAQYAAHFASVAGAEVLGAQGGTPALAKSASLAVAAKNGFTADFVDAKRPGEFSPSYGNLTDQSAHPYAWEVRINRPRNFAFGTILGAFSSPLPVRAVADYGPVVPCIVVLNTGTGVSSGVNLNGTSAKLVAPCGLYINSSDPNRALNANSGTNTVCASDVNYNMPGLVSMRGNSTGQYRSGLCPNMKTVANQPTVKNPYAYLVTVPPTSVTDTASLVSNPASVLGTSDQPNFCYKIDNATCLTGKVDNTGKLGPSGNGNIGCPGNGGCSITFNISQGSYPNGIVVPSINQATVTVNFGTAGSSSNFKLGGNLSISSANAINLNSSNILVSGNISLSGNTVRSTGGILTASGAFNITSDSISINPSQLYVASAAFVPATNNLATSSATLGGSRYYITGALAIGGFNRASVNTSKFYVGSGPFTPTPISMTFGDGAYVMAGGLSISGVNATLGSGEYYLGGSGISLTNSAVTTSTYPDGPNGVTLALMNASVGTVNIGSNATLNLNGPTNGATNSPRYAGFAVVQSPPASTGSSVSGGASTVNSLWNVGGIVVMPNTDLTFKGGNASASCSGFVVWTLTISGNAKINNACPNVAADTSGLVSALPAE